VTTSRFNLSYHNISFWVMWFDLLLLVLNKSLEYLISLLSKRIRFSRLYVVVFTWYNISINIFLVTITSPLLNSCRNYFLYLVIVIQSYYSLLSNLRLWWLHHHIRCLISRTHPSLNNESCCLVFLNCIWSLRSHLSYLFLLNLLYVQNIGWAGTSTLAWKRSWSLRCWRSPVKKLSRFILLFNLSIWGICVDLS
jgi:hypothetical protein